MCEILVRVVSKSNPSDPHRDIRLTKRGDVIVVAPDGWAWSPAEKTNPDWRIVKLPNVGVNVASAYTSDYPGDDLTMPYRPRRAKFLDVDLASLPAAFKSYLLDTTRAAPSFSAAWTPSQLAGFIADRTVPPDPAVIG